MKIHTTYEMQNFILFLTDLFVKEYNKHFSFGDVWQENANILANGYCFYFALTVHKLLPEVKIAVYPGYHYFIFFGNEFFDYRGILPVVDGKIQVFSGSSVSLDHIFIIEDENLMQEISIAEICKVITDEKDRVWEQIEPALLKEGQAYLQDASHLSLKRKIPQN